MVTPPLLGSKPLYPGVRETLALLNRPPEVGLGIATGKSRHGLVSSLERSLIEKAYRAADGNQSQTAKLLRLNRDKLRYHMKSFELI